MEKSLKVQIVAEYALEQARAVPLTGGRRPDWAEEIISAAKSVLEYSAAAQRLMQEDQEHEHRRSNVDANQCPRR